MNKPLSLFEILNALNRFFEGTFETERVYIGVNFYIKKIDKCVKNFPSHSNVRCRMDTMLSNQSFELFLRKNTQDFGWKK